MARTGRRYPARPTILSGLQSPQPPVGRVVGPSRIIALRAAVRPVYRITVKGVGSPRSVAQVLLPSRCVAQLAARPKPPHTQVVKGGGLKIMGRFVPPAQSVALKAARPKPIKSQVVQGGGPPIVGQVIPPARWVAQKAAQPKPPRTQVRKAGGPAVVAQFVGPLRIIALKAAVRPRTKSQIVTLWPFFSITPVLPPVGKFIGPAAFISQRAAVRRSYRTSILKRGAPPPIGRYVSPSPMIVLRASIRPKSRSQTIVPVWFTVPVPPPPPVIIRLIQDLQAVVIADVGALLGSIPDPPGITIDDPMDPGPPSSWGTGIIGYDPINGDPITGQTEGSRNPGGPGSAGAVRPRRRRKYGSGAQPNKNSLTLASGSGGPHRCFQGAVTVLITNPPPDPFGFDGQTPSFSGVLCAIYNPPAATGPNTAVVMRRVATDSDSTAGTNLLDHIAHWLYNHVGTHCHGTITVDQVSLPSVGACTTQPCGSALPPSVPGASVGVVILPSLTP